MSRHGLKSLAREQMLSLVRELTGVLGAPRGHYPELSFRCPFCLERRGSESVNNKLRVNVSFGIAICYRCEFKAGSIQSLVKAVGLTPGLYGDNRTSSMDVDKVRMRLLLSLIPEPPAIGGVALKPLPLPREYVPLAKCTKGALRLAPRYLDRRNIPLKRAIARGVGYCDAGEYAGRLIFPIYQFGKCVYHTNRFAGDHTVKTKNPKNRDGYYGASDVLLGFDWVVGKPEVVVVEGPVSWLSVNRPAVATLGKRISDAQTLLFRELVKAGLTRVVVMRDPDADPTETARALRSEVRDVRIAELRAGDPNDVGDAAVDAHVDAATSDPLEYVLERRMYGR